MEDPTVLRSVRPETADALRIWETETTVILRLGDRGFDLTPAQAREVAAVLLARADSVENTKLTP